jgi:hypothetical protein
VTTRRAGLSPGKRLVAAEANFACEVKGESPAEVTRESMVIDIGAYATLTGIFPIFARQCAGPV